MMSKQIKTRYPKSVHKDRNRFVVKIYSKKKQKTYHVGNYSTVEEAILARDNWLTENYKLVEGYLPRGIFYDARNKNKFVSYFSFGLNEDRIKVHLGSYATIGEAVKARREFILSLL